MTLEVADTVLVSALVALGVVAAGITARGYLRTRYPSMGWLSLAFVFLTLAPALDHLLGSQFHWGYHESTRLGVHGLAAAGLLAVIVSALRARQIPGKPQAT